VGRARSTSCGCVLFSSIELIILTYYQERRKKCFSPPSIVASGSRAANNESSEVSNESTIKPGQRVKLNRSQAVNVHKLLTIR